MLKFLLPRLLHAWGQDLLDLAPDYGGFAGHCLAAFARKPLHPKYLDEGEFKAVANYVSSLLFERMSQETQLRHRGMHATPYKWFYGLGSFIVVFPYLEELWMEWWALKTEPFALCAAEYISCLLYEDDSNPIFDEWTPVGGGGPPALWETGDHIFDEAAQPANVAFLTSLLTPDYIGRSLAKRARL